MADVITIQSSSLPDGTRVIGFRGTESLSRPYVFEVFLQITGPDAHSFELDDLAGAKACLTVSRDDGRPPFLFAGIFSEASLLHEIEERAVVRAVLVPQLWQLSQTQHSRIFTRQSIPDVVRAVLEDSGLSSDDYVFRLSQDYKPEEHVCQFAESNLDFISRWLEREGLYYFFEHEEGGEKLVITDHKSFHKELASDPVRYFPQAGKDATAGEHLRTFTCRKRQLPAAVRFKDYDYNKPTLDVSGTERVSSSGLGEIHLHGARLFTPDTAKRLAKLRSEALQAQERVFQGTGTALYLRAGNTFALTDHPRAAFDTTYLATEVEHHGNQLAGSGDLRELTSLDSDEVYRADVTAITAEVQFRPPQQTTWPRIYGTEHGVIDGEADSEYAQIDDHGRYLVRFAFDESDLKDGKASTWVRMMQPHGGGIEGWHFPLRKGTEVLFTFLGGDPDRPVIAGVVPNALTPSPVTRANHTQNVIQTGGRNRIEMEDKAGYERITISTPHAETMIRMGSPNDQHELIVRTNQNALIDTGANFDVVVAGFKTETVEKDVEETYNALKRETVPNGQVVENYLGPHDTTVHTKRKQVYAQQDKLVKGLFKESIGIHEVTVTGGGRKDNVGGGLWQTVTGEAETHVTGNWIRTIDGVLTETHSGVKRVNKAAKSALTYGTTSQTFIGGTNSNFIGGKIDISVGAFASFKLAAELQITDGMRYGFIGGLDFKLSAALSLTLTPLDISDANIRLKKVRKRKFEGFTSRNIEHRQPRCLVMILRASVSSSMETVPVLA